jgi:hypothetical protein
MNANKQKPHSTLKSIDESKNENLRYGFKMLFLIK